jgi:Ner family transcriptional regulator
MDENKSLNDTQKNEQMVWTWIKQRLANLGSSFAELARLHGLKTQTLVQVKHRPYPKGERQIAASIGLEPWDLWPDRYDERHNPIRISTRYPGHKSYLQLSGQLIGGKDQRHDSKENAHE